MLPKLKTQSSSNSWGNLFVLTTIIAYAYVFMEWLFMITKPSSMSMIGFSKKVEVFLFSSSLIAGGCYLILFVLAVFGFLPVLRQRQKVIMAVGALIPTGILASIILLLLDNFTYTVFKYGIVLTEGYMRRMYALGFLLVFTFCFRYVLKKINNRNQKINRNYSGR